MSMRKQAEIHLETVGNLMDLIHEVAIQLDSPRTKIVSVKLMTETRKILSRAADLSEAALKEEARYPKTGNEDEMAYWNETCL